MNSETYSSRVNGEIDATGVVSAAAWIAEDMVLLPKSQSAGQLIDLKRPRGKHEKAAV